MLADVALVSKTITHPFTLVGNPSTNGIDFGTLAVVNNLNVIKSGYFIWTGSGANAKYEVHDGDGEEIAAWRGFIVEKDEGGVLSFSPFLASAPASLAKKAVKSLAAASEKLTITATNSTGSAYTLLKKSDKGKSTVGSNDLSFLSTGANDYVQLYTVKPDNAGTKRNLAINTLNSYEAQIPVGVQTTYNGT
ncbi:MAG: hypothetical protein LBT29_00835, partial [Flavobacteriaceae bacterium]|nr:hypothetical protein [Flavobacteriaceae bacterium]